MTPPSREIPACFPPVLKLEPNDYRGNRKSGETSPTSQR